MPSVVLNISWAQNWNKRQISSQILPHRQNLHYIWLFYGACMFVNKGGFASLSCSERLKDVLLGERQHTQYLKISATHDSQRFSIGSSFNSWTKPRAHKAAPMTHIRGPSACARSATNSSGTPSCTRRTRSGGLSKHIKQLAYTKVLCVSTTKCGCF